MQHSSWGLTEQGRRAESPPMTCWDTLTDTALAELAFWAANTHCQVMYSPSSTSIPKSFTAALNLSTLQPVQIPGIALSRCRCSISYLILWNFVRVLWAHFSSYVWVPLDGTPSLRCVNCTIQLGVTFKFTEGALNPSMPLTKTLNSTGPITDPWNSLGHLAIDHHPLDATGHPSNPPLLNLERTT